MPVLIFIRHAETDFNRDGIFAGRTDCNITKEGFEKAKELFIKDQKQFDYIYCSPLKRTKQTLEAIIPGSVPIVDERIIENSIVYEYVLDKFNAQILESQKNASKEETEEKSKDDKNKK